MKFGRKIVMACLMASFSASVAFAANVNPISREDGSGTRGAFVEIFGLLDKKVDTTTPRAEITNSTAVMLTTVASNQNAIGYISLGSLSSSVKALQIDGVAPTVANIQNKTYTVSRPFNVVTKTTNPLSEDFLSFVTSKQAQDVITKAGYIPLAKADYTPKNPSGKIVIAGSSSVTPLMEKLKEAYLAQNKQAQIEIQQSDSTTGVNSTVQGIADIGMVSRDLKPSELSKGIKGQVIAIDGLAVIVNPKNPVNNLTKDQVKSIFQGKTTQWEAIK